MTSTNVYCVRSFLRTEFERKQLLADLQKKRLLASELKGQMEMKWVVSCY